MFNYVAVKVKNRPVYVFEVSVPTTIILLFFTSGWTHEINPRSEFPGYVCTLPHV